MYVENEIQGLSDLRAAALDPLTGWRHELITVPEWNDETIAVREPTVGDRMFWIEPLQDAARVTDEDDEPAAREKYERISAAAHSQASARLFVRVVFVKTSSSWQRLFADEDVGAIVTAYGAVHDRVVVKALELGKLNVDPVEDGKKPSAEPQVSAS